MNEAIIMILIFGVLAVIAWIFSDTTSRFETLKNDRMKYCSKNEWKSKEREYNIECVLHPEHNKTKELKKWLDNHSYGGDELLEVEWR